MAKVVLISCVSQKRSYKCKAVDLYISTLFKKSLKYAIGLHPDRIFILSAKYGLVQLDDEIEPYNLTLKSMPVREVKQWAQKVLDQLLDRADLQNDEFVLLASEIYRKYIVPHLTHVDIPLEGLRIGQQLHRLSQ